MATRLPRRQVFKGFSTVDGQGQLSDLELVKQDILNHFNTQKGERVMDPTFGSIVWDLLFDNFSEYTRERIIEDTREIIENDPRVELYGIIVDQFEHGIMVQLDLMYTPFNVEENLSVLFDREQFKEGS